MTFSPARSVLIALDSIKHPNTGLYHFGKSLTEAILRADNPDIDYTFYLPANQQNLFDNRVKKIAISRFHRLHFPYLKKFDLFHFTCQYNKIVRQKISAKKVLTVHDLNQLHEYKDDKGRLQKYFGKMNPIISSCDKIIAISKFVAEDIKKNFPGCDDKVSVIYNGADKLQTLANHLPLYHPERKFLFSIGIVSRKKNVHILPALLQNNDLELVISGINNDSAYVNDILNQAKKFGCENRVKITGTISAEDKAWYYENCHAFVFPSLAEGFGLPVIEAMHFGKPVFLSTATSLPEIGGDAAYYFTDFSPEKLQETFAKGMQDYVLKNLSSKIIAHAETFTWDKAAAQYIELYKTL